jgi:putative SOS response-associated peptidase YedK
MCNRYRNELRKLGQLDSEFSETRIRLRFPKVNLKDEIFPDRSAVVLRLDEKGRMEPDVMRWGFPPVQGNVVTNVRNPEKSFWRNWLKAEWRCLVPATAFAEWSPSPPKGDRWFEPADGLHFCFAGIWRHWTGTRGTKSQPVTGEHKLFAFLTTKPNAIVAPIHPKAMPVILPRQEWDTWLTGSVEDALALQMPAPDASLKLIA